MNGTKVLYKRIGPKVWRALGVGLAFALVVGGASLISTGANEPQWDFALGFVALALALASAYALVFEVLVGMRRWLHVGVTRTNVVVFYLATATVLALVCALAGLLRAGLSLEDFAWTLVNPGFYLINVQSYLLPAWALGLAWALFHHSRPLFVLGVIVWFAFPQVVERIGYSMFGPPESTIVALLLVGTAFVVLTRRLPT